MKSKKIKEKNTSNTHIFHEKSINLNENLNENISFSNPI